MRVLKSILVFGILISSFNCVQKTHLKTVTFRVNMQDIQNVANVGVRGNFTDTPWKETVPLTDKDNDGIYEGIFNQKTAANQVQFKFVNQKSEFELQDSDNRVIKFQYKPEIITYKAAFNNPNEEIIRN